MKNILWLFLFSMLMSIESFGTLASYEADIQTLLSSGRSSFIAGKIREVLRSRLDSGPLTSDKIRKLIQSPQVAALCCLHQFFNTAEGGKPSVGPEHAYLHDIGRVNYVTATDEEAVDAFFKLSRYEGIIPALESSHAIAYAMKWARENRGGAILVNCSGRGDKDVDYVVEHYGYGEDHQFPA